MSEPAGASAAATIPDAGVVRRLLREQFPPLAGETVRPSRTQGSSNVVFRVGAGHAVRLPRTAAYRADLEKEARWLPHLAPRLGVPVPELAFLGRPSGVFPHPWTVVTWLPGRPPGALTPPAQRRLADGLGRFVRRLHRLDPGGLPAGADAWGYRAGEPVTAEIDEWADRAAEALSVVFRPERVRLAWRRLRDVPPASGPPCWVHTDLSGENLLTTPRGDLAGVIDFGGLGVGDPAVDLLYAWQLFDEPARARFRAAAGADEATWRRARAWAFVGPGLMSIAGYRHTMPERTTRLTAMVEAVAAEVGVALG